MTLDGLVLVGAVVLTGAGAVAWWAWRRRVVAEGEQAVALGREAVELLRAILAAVRRPTPPDENTPDDYPKPEP